MTDAGVPQPPSHPASASHPTSASRPASPPALGLNPFVAPRPASGPFDRTPAPPSAVGVALTAFWQRSRDVMPTRTLMTCGAVGLAGGVLVAGHRLGLGAALVGLAVWAPAVPALLRRRAVVDLVTAALSVALVAVVAVRDAGWVVGLCLAVAAWAAAVAVTSARSGAGVVLSAVSGLAGFVRALPWAARGGRAVVGTRRGQLVVALRSVGVTAVLLVVFGVLFASADRVFASYLPRLDLSALPGQVTVGVLAALVAATLAHLALAPPAWSDVAVPAGRPSRLGEWLLPVVALDAMVMAFVLVQVGALLGGHRHVLETAGLTYAEYARQGFAQLVVATALTLVVVAVAARRAPRSSDRDRLVVRVALGVLCLGSVGVVVSALRRMDLYVDAFGLTRLRVLVVVAEAVLGVVLVLVMVAGVRWRAGWLPRAVVQVVAVAMLGLAVANPDAQIVRVNTTPGVAHVDVAYLQGLSADAASAMDRLDEPLRSCLLAGLAVAPSGGFADWNVGRERAAAALRSGVDGAAASACAG